MARTAVPAGVVMAASVLAAAASVWAQEVRDLSGAAMDPFARDGAATVLVFVATDCPISNRYAPEIGRVAARFARQQVSLWLVYADPRTDADAARMHRAEYALQGVEAVLDPAHVLVRRAGATVTPEAAVFSRDGTLRYRGRIDDRFIDITRSRPSPTRHDLELAVGAVVAGKTVTPETSPPVGCAIAMAGRDW